MKVTFQDKKQPSKGEGGGILSSFYSIISGGSEGSGKMSESENAAKVGQKCRKLIINNNLIAYFISVLS